jgi:O-antigen/teichoic acid export membrane protein
LLTQLTWVLPDSGLIGLAQIHGEGRLERVREVAGGMLRVLLTLAGAVTLVVLAVNPQFVGVWVGREFFGGHALNVLLAAGVLGTSLVHGLSVVEAVLGQRLKVGLAGLVGGAVQVTLAIFCGRLWGLEGVALAMLIATMTVTLPVGVYLLRPTLGLSPGWLVREVITPWGRRAWIPIAGAWLLGFWQSAEGFWLTVVVSVLLVTGYLWWTRPLYQDLPLPPRVRTWLVAVRLAPDT